MSGLLVLLAGAGIGLGGWLVYDALHPAAGSGASPGVAEPPDASGWGWAARAGHPVARVLARAGVGLPARLARDLAICDRDPARHLAEKITAAAAGVLAAPVLAVLVGTVGITLPAVAWSAVPVLAAAGFLAPDAAVLAEATAARRDWRHALGAFLDLAVISLAGGAGVEQALTHAAATGHGPQFTALRHTLEQARLTRQPLWDPLGRLGEKLGVAELVELAASVRLAGTEGARVRASLAAKAAGVRLHLLTDTEGDAASATERMSLPVVLMFAGFLLFLAYPAVTGILTGL